jgi:hypothetical protein
MNDNEIWTGFVVVVVSAVVGFLVTDAWKRGRWPGDDD